MEIGTTSYYDYMERPKLLAENDFWGQVRKTVHGKSLSEEHIALSVEDVIKGLNLNKSDVILDIGCGNGAFASRLFPYIQSYHGFDMSPHLISIAKKYFEVPPHFTFCEGSVSEFIPSRALATQATKATCNAAFAYFSEEDIISMLANFYNNFIKLSNIFIGFIPDKDKAECFFDDNVKPDITDYTTAIGRWYSRPELAALCKQSGWDVTFFEPHPMLDAARYRYDALLSR